MNTATGFFGSVNHDQRVILSTLQKFPALAKTERYSKAKELFDSKPHYRRNHKASYIDEGIESDFICCIADEAHRSHGKAMSEQIQMLLGEMLARRLYMLWQVPYVLTCNLQAITAAILDGQRLHQS